MTTDHSAHDDPGQDRPDYEAILAAVTETPRGRWFLAEYQRRNRAADTAAVLDQIARLETLLVRQSPELAQAQHSAALADLATILALTPADAAPGSAQAAPGTGLTGDIVTSLALDIGQAGEETREALLTARGAVLSLRENPSATRFFDALDRQLKAIDGHAGAVQAAARRVEALAQIVGLVRDKLRLVLAARDHAPATSAQDAAPELAVEAAAPARAEPAIAIPAQSLPAQPLPDRSMPDRPMPDQPMPTAAAGTGRAVAPPAQPAADFEQVWQVPLAAPDSPLRHVAALMQEASAADEHTADDPLVALHAQAAPSAHAGRTLADLDRLSYTERAALFA